VGGVGVRSRVELRGLGEYLWCVGSTLGSRCEGAIYVTREIQYELRFFFAVNSSSKLANGSDRMTFD
jgi:hypothetical protein